MNSVLKPARSVALTLFTLFAGPLLAGSAVAQDLSAQDSVVRVTATDGEQQYTSLLTESAWMSIAVPQAVLDGTPESEITFAVRGLPEGVTIKLDGASTSGDTVLFDVTVERKTTDENVNAVATIDLLAGGRVLTTVSIPVLGAAETGD